jgi:hypothetical protein
VVPRDLEPETLRLVLAEALGATSPSAEPTPEPERRAA